MDENEIEMHHVMACQMERDIHQHPYNHANKHQTRNHDHDQLFCLRSSMRWSSASSQRSSANCFMRLIFAAIRRIGAYSLIIVISAANC